MTMFVLHEETNPQALVTLATESEADSGLEEPSDLV